MTCFETDTIQTHTWYLRFAVGDETALTSIAMYVQKPLISAAKQIVKDEFVVNTIVQDTILKSWQFRHRISGFSHLYRFMRLNVKWQCYAWYRKPVNRFHRSIVYSEYIENHAAHSCSIEQETYFEPHMDKWKLILKALPFLPPQRQTIVQLYFSEGLPVAAIAQRFHLSSQSVRDEINHSLSFLKRMVLSQHAPPASIGHTQEQLALPPEMDAIMQQIFKLRREQKLDFTAIAQQLNLPQPHVLQQYITASKIFSNQKIHSSERKNHSHI